MEDRQVRYEVKGAQAVLTIDRPQQRNALSGQVVAELREALTRAEGDPQVRVLVVTGAGENPVAPAPGLTA